MIEVELKFPLPPGPAAERVFAECATRGGTFGEPVTQADTYYRHPVRDFAATDEALRVRVVTGADGVARGRLTYKGPRTGGPAKSREEFEPRLTDGANEAAALAAALDRLGFAAVRTVVKTRRTAVLSVPDGDPGPGDDGAPRRFEVTRDSVDGLGEYLEVETVVESGEPDAAATAVRTLATALGLGAPEPRSYLELLLERDERESR